MNIYISIGNSDDRLSQAEWSGYVNDVRVLIEDTAEAVHGIFFSQPDSRYQNACFSLGMKDEKIADLKKELAYFAACYNQESIAFCSGTAELILAENPPEEELWR